MAKNTDQKKWLVNWGGPVRLLLALALAVPLLASAPTTPSSATPHAHPVLLQMALESPDSLVNVIVQKSGNNKSAEDLVVQVGGTVTQNLHIINAFAANMPAKAAVDLSMANSVRWVSLDAPVVKTATSADAISTANLLNTYDRAVGADRVWNSTNYLQGQGVGVAVVDSGVSSGDDFRRNPNGSGSSRIVASVSTSSLTNNNLDQYGHGTHVAGIIGGNGRLSNGAYIGVAPRVNLINVKVSDDEGAATASDVIEGLQYVLNNKTAYNIRVVNLSLNSSVMASYHTDPIDAAAEVLWFNGIVVVTSAGNNGTTGLFPPANDPFVITVGATDDRGTASIGDDTIPAFSAYGTVNGVAKPDLVAPGTNIISTISTNNTTLQQEHRANEVGPNPVQYFRMSGTSMAAPMVAAAAALLLQDEPNLTPDQVKYRLKNTAVSSTTTWPAYNATKAGSGYLNIYAAVMGTTTASSNTNIAASQLLWTGSQPITWNSVNWNSVNWNSVNWNSVNWNSVNWNSVNWGSDYWAP